jgi:hypothetical protein
LEGEIGGKPLIVAAAQARPSTEPGRAGDDAETAKYFHENLLINMNPVRPDIESDAGQESGF